MNNLADVLARQRRFQRLLLGLLVLALAIGLLIVPVEKNAPESKIKSLFDGIWWSVTTITSVGYGDMVPITNLGKVLGMILQVSVVLAFGLLVSLVTVSLDEAKERYFRNRLDERFNQIEEKLDKLGKQSGYVVKQTAERNRVE